MIETTREEETIAIEPPPYVVMYFDDDVTTFDFVIESLIKHFDYTLDRAIDISCWIDIIGVSIVASLPHSIAEQRVYEIEREARVAGFPLRVHIEPDNMPL